MAVDLGVFDRAKTFQDYNQAEQEFQLRKQLAQQQMQSGNIDALTKKNIYATQVISAAAASGKQEDYDRARQVLNANGIDTSAWAPDIQTGAQQAQAARLAQSPLGSLLNAGLKLDSNNIALGGLTGQIPALNGVSSILGGVALPASPPIQDTANPKTITPAQAQAQAHLTSGAPLPNGQPDKQPVSYSNPQQLIADSATGATPDLPKAQAAPSPIAPAPSFSPPPQNPNETIQAYNQRVQRAFEAYKADPNVIAAQKEAEKQGEFAATNKEGANVQTETLQRLNQNLDALKTLNANLPDYGGILPVGIKARGSLIAGDERGYDALQKWDEINQQQVVNAIGDLVKGGQIRGNQFIEKIINRGYAVDPQAPRKTREDQIEILRNELKNAATQAQNIAGGNGAYTPTLPTSAAPPQGAILYGTSGGKKVYKMPDGTFLMEQ